MTLIRIFRSVTGDRDTEDCDDYGDYDHHDHHDHQNRDRDEGSGPDGTSTRFLHDPENESVDPEGGMAKSKLHRINTMSEMLGDIIQHNDQLPPWVQDHIAAAYENLDQVFGYIEPRASEHEDDCEVDMSPKMAAVRARKAMKVAEGKQPLKDPKGGLTAAGRAHFKRTEGANLKPGVKGPADTPEKKKRKGSFLTRMFGPGGEGSMKKDNGEPSRRALSARAWGEPVPQNDSDRAALYAKGKRMLDSYKNKKEGADAPKCGCGRTMKDTGSGWHCAKCGPSNKHDGYSKKGSSDETPPWEKDSPKKKPSKMTSAQKTDAKRRAREAGRPYPNLVDNMAAKSAELKVGKAPADFSMSPRDLRTHYRSAVGKGETSPAVGSARQTGAMHSGGGFK